MKSPTLENHKSLLRNKLKISLKRISAANCKKKSEKIIRRILGSKDFPGAGKILSYIALPGEVQTEELIFKAWALGKKVYAPFVNVRKREIEIYEIRHWNDLRKGAFGILEPRRSKNRKGKPAELDLVIVPGIGFDRKGRRLGRGGGYFDKFLKETRRAKKIGVAFKEQIVRKVPVAAHDIKMDRVITD